LSLADKKATPLVSSPFNETHAQISPDGKWIAYTSDSVGMRREIHVQPFPSGAGRWQISDGGGDWARWRQDGKELLYHSIGPIPSPQTPTNLSFMGPLYSVLVSGAGGTFEHAPPKTLLAIRANNLPHSGGDYHTYAVSPDGERLLYFQFVVATPAGTAATAQSSPDHPSGLMVAMNWAEALKR
jgi:hypothetical protein